jgi:hypothetical protein
VSALTEKMEALGVRPVAGPFRPLSPQQTSELETHLRSKLPADYREFLLTFGRCGFDALAEVRASATEASSVLMFFGAPEEGRSDDLFWHLDTSSDHLPAGSLVIGDDEFGNPYVLDAKTGKVSYIDYAFGGGKGLPIPLHRSGIGAGRVVVFSTAVSVRGLLADQRLKLSASHEQTTAQIDTRQREGGREHQIMNLANRRLVVVQAVQRLENIRLENLQFPAIGHPNVPPISERPVGGPDARPN